MSTGTPYPYRDEGTGGGLLREFLSVDDRPALLRRIAELEADVKRLSDEITRREELAYEHGLGDRAKVYRDNRLLAATINALVAYRHVLSIGEIITEKP